MTREEQIELWLNRRWRTSEKNSRYLIIEKHNVAVMKYHLDTSKWKYAINPPSGPTQWSDPDYFDSEEEAMRAALEALADLLGYV